MHAHVFSPLPPILSLSLPRHFFSASLISFSIPSLRSAEDRGLPVALLWHDAQPDSWLGTGREGRCRGNAAEHNLEFCRPYGNLRRWRYTNSSSRCADCADGRWRRGWKVSRGRGATEKMRARIAAAENTRGKMVRPATAIMADRTFGKTLNRSCF